MADHPKPTLAEKHLQRLREQLRECAAGLGGEVSTRRRAASLGEAYLHCDAIGRHQFLSLIAHEFGPDPKAVAAAHLAYQQALGSPAQWLAESNLRGAMRSSRLRILTQFNALPQGVKFIVDLRADLLRFLEQDPLLAGFDRELESRLTAWFDVGFLELQRITWHSPAVLLEKLIAYEAVHEISSWADLKNRLDSDRRCYAFFHPRMPEEPLIFVEVALVDKLADSVQHLLDQAAPVFDAQRADTAIFYSISNTQDGLRGVSFGNFLLKRVIDDLKRDYPRLNTFATLSPLPGLRAWLEKNPATVLAAFSAKEASKLQELSDIALHAPTLLKWLASGVWASTPKLVRLLEVPLQKLGAHYLFAAKKEGRPVDPVARFHLGNGARIERLNWLADTSSKGFKQSFGLMVNYLYEPEALETNVEAFVREGTVAAKASIRHAAKL